MTCWEVFSGGKTPYPGIHAMDLPHQLDNGMRLEKPLNAACTDEMYVAIATVFWFVKIFSCSSHTKIFYTNILYNTA